MIVIADDITGAAEIAGMAFAAGQQVRLLCGCPVDGDIVADHGTVVIATDTRSMEEHEAVAETCRIASAISRQSSAVFKKTDSALRGHVVAELAALMHTVGYQRSVYLPANPSKGRIVRNGIYYIHHTPIHETDFRFDPEYPATTSVLQERFPDATDKEIIMPDATSIDGICHMIEDYADGNTLFAGAADLFQQLLIKNGAFVQQEIGRKGDVNSFKKHADMIILCGSTQSTVLETGIPVAPMSRENYDGSSNIDLWNTSAYSDCHRIILSIPFHHRTGKDTAVHLRNLMAQKTKMLVEQHCPTHLIIEGGATAWATLQTLGWTEFEIVAQLAPGVVQMRAANGTLVTLKPGSYPWGSSLFGH